MSTYTAIQHETPTPNTLPKHKINKLSRGETICPPPIAADLRPCADGSAVRAALVAYRAAVLPIAYDAAGLGASQLEQTDGQTAGRIAVLLNAPLRRGRNK